MSDARTPEGGEVGYAEAMTELGRILSELEHDDVDVDRLADRVARAAELIEICRRRIQAAKVEIDRIVVEPADGNDNDDEPA